MQLFEIIRNYEHLVETLLPYADPLLCQSCYEREKVGYKFCDECKRTDQVRRNIKYLERKAEKQRRKKLALVG